MTSETRVGLRGNPTLADIINPIIDPDPSWRLEAKCATEPVGNFYPKEGLKGVQSKNHINKAVAFCQDCPVKARCFQYAVDNHERYGVWGGVHFGEVPARDRKGFLNKGAK